MPQAPAGTAKPTDILAPLSKAPYVHTLHRRPHQHARRMTEPARACVRARARVLCTVRCALHVHVPFTWCSLLVASGARLPADPCCSQRWRLTPRFASSAQAQCAGVAGAAIVAGAVAWSTVHRRARPGHGVPWCCGSFFTDFQLHLHPFIGM